MKSSAIILVLFMFSVLILVGCSQPTGCTEEAKICPDGSSVGRIGPDCEFPECPEVKPVSNDSVDTEIPEAEPDINTSNNSMIDSEYPETDSDVDISGDIEVDSEIPEGKLKVNECNESQRGQSCSNDADWTPVCSWYNQSVTCVDYPCSGTYANSCEACRDAKVAYWTEGPCEGFMD